MPCDQSEPILWGPHLPEEVVHEARVGEVAKVGVWVGGVLALSVGGCRLSQFETKVLKGDVLLVLSSQLKHERFQHCGFNQADVLCVQPAPPPYTTGVGCGAGGYGGVNGGGGGLGVQVL